MKDKIQVAGGSVMGRDHRDAHKNNQDAFHHRMQSGTHILFVADGCSESTSSEVGARVILRMVTELVLKRLQAFSGLDPRFDIDFWSLFWERVRLDALAQIRVFAQMFDGSFSENVSGNFLAAILGAVVTPEVTVIAGVGDGVYALDGQIEILGPFPNNQPPYLAYGLIGSSFDETPDLLKFHIHKIVRTPDVRSILIGTDGVSDLIRARTRPIPGKNVQVGPLEQLWTNDHFYENPAALSRFLFSLNREVARPLWEAREVSRERGLLPDDTTLVVLRRVLVGQAGEKSSLSRSVVLDFS